MNDFDILIVPYKKTTYFTLIKAFFLKELKIWLRYGTLIILDFFKMIQPILLFYFISKMVSAKIDYSYFHFVSIGLIFSHFTYEIMMA